jgi:hypothetical protein
VGTAKGQTMEWFITLMAFGVFLMMASTEMLMSWVD